MSNRTKRWAIALVVSLSLNLFLGGMLVGRWMFRPDDARPYAKRLSLQRARRYLDPAAHAVLDEVATKHEDEIRSRMRAARKSRRRAMDALAADPFDEAEARAAFADFGSKSLAAQQAAHDAMVELAGKLTPAQRVQLREAMKRPRRRGGARRP